MTMDAFSPLFVILLVAIPLFEACYAIPFAILIDFSPGYGFVLGIIGNLLPVIPLLPTLGPVSAWLQARCSQMDRFFSWLFTRTRRNKDLVYRWGALALFLFVAIPLPMTGSWSGCAMAFVFNIEFKGAFAAISTGAVVVALITTLPTRGLLKIFGSVS
jgi:uncharacterized membrane protein